MLYKKFKKKNPGTESSYTRMWNFVQEVLSKSFPAWKTSITWRSCNHKICMTQTPLVDVKKMTDPPINPQSRPTSPAPSNFPATQLPFFCRKRRRRRRKDRSQVEGVSSRWPHWDKVSCCCTTSCQASRTGKKPFLIGKQGRNLGSQCLIYRPVWMEDLIFGWI